MHRGRRAHWHAQPTDRNAYHRTSRPQAAAQACRRWPDLRAGGQAGPPAGDHFLEGDVRRRCRSANHTPHEQSETKYRCFQIISGGRRAGGLFQVGQFFTLVIDHHDMMIMITFIDNFNAWTGWWPPQSSQGGGPHIVVARVGPFGKRLVTLSS